MRNEMTHVKPRGRISLEENTMQWMQMMAGTLLINLMNTWANAGVILIHYLLTQYLTRELICSVVLAYDLYFNNRKTDKFFLVINIKHKNVN